MRSWVAVQTNSRAKSSWRCRNTISTPFNAFYYFTLALPGRNVALLSVCNKDVTESSGSRAAGRDLLQKIVQGSRETRYECVEPSGPVKWSR